MCGCFDRCRDRVVSGVWRAGTGGGVECWGKGNGVREQERCGNAGDKGNGVREQEVVWNAGIRGMACGNTGIGVVWNAGVKGNGVREQERCGMLGDKGNGVRE